MLVNLFCRSICLAHIAGFYMFPVSLLLLDGRFLCLHFNSNSNDAVCVFYSMRFKHPWLELCAVALHHSSQSLFMVEHNKRMHLFKYTLTKTYVLAQ